VTHFLLPKNRNLHCTSWYPWQLLQRRWGRRLRIWHHAIRLRIQSRWVCPGAIVRVRTQNPATAHVWLSWTFDGDKRDWSSLSFTVGLAVYYISRCSEQRRDFSSVTVATPALISVINSTSIRSPSLKLTFASVVRPYKKDYIWTCCFATLIFG